MINKTLRDNPLRTFEDVQKACYDLYKPLVPYYTEGRTGIVLGSTQGHCSERALEMEGFTRALWGIVPLVAGGGRVAELDMIREGIANGCNPEHPEYWGEPANQEFVEMAALALGIALVPEELWHPFDQATKDRLASWMIKINTHPFIVGKKDNWQFFKILVNAALRKVGSPYFDAEALETSLGYVDEMYLGDGWYNDGVPQEGFRQRDYYVPFALMFYSLIYAGIAGDVDPERADRFKERAAVFAKDFRYWFDETGSALPFGRSLAYRFAQGCFWGALAFANVEALPWGEIKGLILQHFRWWFAQPMFTEGGFLSVGYSYPNQNMAEQYNAPGSPYWAFKAFLLLATGPDHPLWRADEQPITKPAEVVAQPHPGFIICSSKEIGHTYCLNAGQWATFNCLHMEEKYEKFGYSTHFAFNVQTGVCGLDRQAPDNMIMFSEEDEYYRGKRQSYDHEIIDGYISCKWKPWKNVEVQTWLVPLMPWDLRIHHVVSERNLWSAEGAFPVPVTDLSHYHIADYMESGDDFAMFHEAKGMSGLAGVPIGNLSRTGELIFASPNANLIHQRTIHPVLRGKHPKGGFWLASLVMAHPDAKKGLAIWQAKPSVSEILDRVPARIKDLLEATGCCIT